MSPGREGPRRLVALSAALLVSALSAPSEAGAQSWVGDFETGDTSQYGFLLNPEVGGRRYINVVSDVVASGSYAARIELHDDARWPNGLRRVEVQHGPTAARTAEGAELFFAWSIYLPETLSRDPDQTIGYWESSASYRQLMAFQLTGEDLRFSTNRPSWAAHWTGTGVVTPRTWHRIAMRVLWSTDPSVGEVDVWFDGEQVVSGAHAATLADTNSAFVQFGLLRGDADFSDVPVIYVDDALEGASLEQVRGIPAAIPGDAGAMPADAGVAPSGDAAAMSADAASAGADAARRAIDGGSGGGEITGSSCRVAPGRGVGGAAWALILGGWLVVFATRRLRLVRRTANLAG